MSSARFGLLGLSGLLLTAFIALCIVIATKMPGDLPGVGRAAPRTELPSAFEVPRAASKPGSSSQSPLGVSGGLATETPGQQVIRLIKSPSPSDGFAAAETLRLCAIEKAAGAGGGKGGVPYMRACEDITSGLMTMRYALVQRASDAQVPGAAFYGLRTTPDGVSVGMLDQDPAYAYLQAGARKRVEEAAERGDSLSILLMAIWTRDTSSSTFDPSAALVYWTAYADRVSYEDPRYVGNSVMQGKLRAQTLERVNEYSQRMPSDAVAAAIERGHAIAALHPQTDVVK